MHLIRDAGGVTDARPIQGVQDSRVNDAAIAPKGMLRVVAGDNGGPGFIDGVGKAARLISPRAMASDGAGHLYFLDDEGNALRVIDLATRHVSTVYFANQATIPDAVDASSTRNPPLGIMTELAYDGNGTLFATYGTTLRKFDVVTWKASLFNGAPLVGGSTGGTGLSSPFSHLKGITSDRAGHLFVTDAIDHTVSQIVIATGKVTTIAGSPGATGYTDGIGARARFDTPDGLTYDGHGHLFVTDQSNSALRRIVVATGEVTTILGPTKPDPAEPAPVFGEHLFRIHHPAADGSGNVYLVERASPPRVKRLNVETGVLSTVVDFDEEQTSEETQWIVANRLAGLSISIDWAGNLFVADPPRYSIRMIRLATGEISTLAGAPERRGVSGEDGVAALFDRPLAMIAGRLGTLFVADTENATLRKVDPSTGTITTIAGSPKETGDADGRGREARFGKPSSLAFDGQGHLIVADPPNCALRQVDIEIGEVTTLPVRPSQWRTPGSNTCSKAMFSIASDSAETLFIVDSEKHTLWKLQLGTGEATFLADVPITLSASGGGQIGTHAVYPNGMAYNGAGILYLTEPADNSLRMVDVSTGESTTLVGPSATGGFADGNGNSASLLHPTGLAIDSDGNLLIADADNRAVRKFDVGTRTLTTVFKSPQQVTGIEPITAGLLFPVALVVGPGRELFILDAAEDAIFSVRL